MLRAMLVDDEPMALEGLRLHYGEAVSLSIRNAEDRGTIVSIRIPAEGE